MPFFYGIYNGSMRTLYEKVGLFYIFLTLSPWFFSEKIY